MKLVSADEMRRVEERAAAEGTTSEMLMERAARALVREVSGGRPPGTALVLVGPGNNGGDGIMAASILAEAGWTVLISPFRREIGADERFSVVKFSALAAENTELPRVDVVIDALLGSGQDRLVEGDLLAVVERLNAQTRPPTRMVAVDVPTGVASDTGRVLGAAIRADSTVCMGLPKPGLFIYPGAEYAGDVTVASLGLSPALADASQTSLPTPSDIAAVLPRRSADSNKGTFGRVLVVGGSVDYRGAPALASMAAYRVGAGLVEVLAPAAVRDSISAHVSECVYSQGRAAGDALDSSSAGALETGASRAACVAFGSGLSQTDGTLALTEAFLASRKGRTSSTAVVDADGLNTLARLGDWWNGQGGMILTPHPGEMARLTGLSVSDVQGDRLRVVRDHARLWNQVVVLKGAGTLVAHPDGRVSVNPTGGPNLAVAGTGDVLTGVIAGLVAQGCEPFTAAVAGAYLHGAAGDLLAQIHGDAGTLAGDLPEQLPAAKMQIIRSEYSYP